MVEIQNVFFFLILQKSSYIKPVDRNSIKLAKVIHIWSGFKHFIGYFEDYGKSSIRLTKSKSWIKKKTKLNFFIVRTKKELKKNDGSFFFFKNNSCIFLKKKKVTLGKKFIGTTPIRLRKKKIFTLFESYI